MLALVSILADMANGDGQDHMWGNGAWAWVWGAVMMVVIVALAVALIIWLVRGAGRAPLPPPPDPTHEAKSILAKRFASGEITLEEYRERLSQLG